ncbi:ATP-dependent DNA helicase RecG [Limibaculum sp. M0105]|uniref:Probable DNA 3'-5' helicase RecG n=1 Tax=Thermohalobaculum xanthum TaxID=2753746 RepID=A0A8J7M4D7_9RHOB|nr:ATP-dependent DNA helicase RecG [Thermohalobaculum xanthum]MBK0397973.1 ATP-dependent DNA helicase RecG [Thermohalobaculum xanthum]
MARPEILFPLFADAAGIMGVGPRTAKALARIGLERVIDLIFHLPTGVIDRRPRESLIGATAGEVATVRIEVGEHHPPRRETQPYRIVVHGGGIVFELLYFRPRKDWLKGALPEGAVRVVSGRVDFYDGRLQMAHPDLVMTEAEAAGLPPFEPVYGLTEGVTGRLMAKAVSGALARAPDVPEWLDPAMMTREAWPDWRAALGALHMPDGPPSLSHGAPARRRLAYDELLSHQLALQIAREKMRRGKGQATAGDGSLRARAAAAFGYPPTGAQKRAIAEVGADMAEDTRMMRLLQGDVGAGKTWVAAMALMIAAEAGGQGALMAPTEILARQHAANLAPIAAAAGVECVLLTGRDKGGAREEKLAAIAGGRARLVIGTHALFSGDVTFRDLRLAVIDEQHRFGVRQRMELTSKAPKGCDLLVMTATPIPRTLALAGYGDLDISVLDEKPPGRQPVETRLVSLSRADEVVARLKAVLAEGRRAYWVCPAVEESDASDLVAVETRHRLLADALGAEHVALVHGQMPADAKDAAMAAFQSGERPVLVATTVIEVGVDVPEATIMVIEQAEHFGLAQLHQLRGRVGRGAGRSFCLLLYAPPLGETARARLEIMRATEDGFRIAEEDLRLRGAGDLIGTAQSGLPRFRIADLDADRGLMEMARDDARLVLTREPGLDGPRGVALRTLLYLFERDASVRLLKGG